MKMRIIHAFIFAFFIIKNMDILRSISKQYNLAIWLHYVFINIYII
jgi:hypothetical protein